MTVDCENCRLFALPRSGEQKKHSNRPGGLELTSQALNLCTFPRNGRMLDIACGLGATLALLNERFEKPAIGLDRSGKMLRSALVDDPGSNVLMGDCFSIPLVSGSITGVLMECALSLSYRSLDTLKEIKRILAPGGKAIITDIFLRELDSSFDRQCLQKSRCISGVMYREEILEQFSQAGFLLDIWQDHTLFLKKWMIENIFRMGSATDFFRLFTGGRNDPEMIDTLSRKIKLGYFLAILSVSTMTEPIAEVENG